MCGGLRMIKRRRSISIFENFSFMWKSCWFIHACTLCTDWQWHLCKQHFFVVLSLCRDRYGELSLVGHWFIKFCFFRFSANRPESNFISSEKQSFLSPFYWLKTSRHIGQDDKGEWWWGQNSHVKISQFHHINNDRSPPSPHHWQTQWQV